MATKRKDRALFGGAGRTPSVDPNAPLTADQEISADIEQVEKDIHELRATYELYFMGVEKLEPLTQRDLLKSKLRRWQQLKPRNTALRFRVQQLKARLVSLENYWERTTRQREAGNYRRDRARVERRAAELRAQQTASRAQAQAANAMSADQPMSTDGVPIPSGVLRPGSPSSAGSGGTTGSSSHDESRIARPRATSAADLTEPKLRRLYQTYVGARKRCGESVDLRYEDMAAALRKQVPKLMNSTGAKSVEFKVVIRKGQAILKALPKH